jgi:hypothetical protein
VGCINVSLSPAIHWLAGSRSLLGLSDESGTATHRATADLVRPWKQSVVHAIGDSQARMAWGIQGVEDRHTRSDHPQGVEW